METKIKHPGWAIKFEDGSYVGFAHGIHDVEPLFAHIFDSKEDAGKWFTDVKAEFSVPCNVVEAWEPKIAELLYKIDKLERMNKINPEDFYRFGRKLEEARDVIDEAIEYVNKKNRD